MEGNRCSLISWVVYLWLQYAHSSSFHSYLYPQGPANWAWVMNQLTRHWERRQGIWTTFSLFTSQFLSTDSCRSFTLCFPFQSRRTYPQIIGCSGLIFHLKADLARNFKYALGKRRLETSGNILGVGRGWLQLTPRDGNSRTDPHLTCQVSTALTGDLVPALHHSVFPKGGRDSGLDWRYRGGTVHANNPWAVGNLKVSSIIEPLARCCTYELVHPPVGSRITGEI